MNMRNTIQTKCILTSLLLKLLIVKPKIIAGKSISRFKVMKMQFQGKVHNGFNAHFLVFFLKG